MNDNAMRQRSRSRSIDLFSCTLGVTLALSLTIYFSCVFHAYFSSKLEAWNGGVNQVALIALYQNSASTNPSFLPPESQAPKPPEGSVTPGEDLPRRPTPFPAEPHIVVLNPTARITNFGNGTVNAAFEFTLTNAGGRLAKDVKAEWRITDNHSPITNPDDWRKTEGKPPWSPKNLQPGQRLTYIYSPDIVQS